MSETRYRYLDENGQHMHTLDGKPLIGTSTVASEALPKPGLPWWAAEQAAIVCLEAGLCVPTIREEYEELCALIGYEKRTAREKLQKKYPIFKKARYAHKQAKESAAQPGTDMHGLLEDYIKDCIAFAEGEPLGVCTTTPELERFSSWACSEVKQFIFSEGYCYSEELWTGGICDCGAWIKGADPLLACLDFKSSPTVYFGQFVQTGGYVKQILENGVLTSNGEQSLIAPRRFDLLGVFPFGGNHSSPVFMREVGAYCEAFEAAVIIYKLMQTFDQ